MFCSSRIWIMMVMVAILAACGSTGGQKTQAGKNFRTPQERQAYAAKDLRYAIALMRKGRTGKAITVLEKMTVDYPRMAGPWSNLGILYQQMGRLDDAENALKRSIELNDKVPMAHNQLGIVYRKKGKFRQARKQYLRALRLNDKYSLAHLNLGILYDLYLGELDEALTHYRAYQQLTPVKDKQVTRWIKDLQRRTKRNVSKNP